MDSCKECCITVSLVVYKTPPAMLRSLLQSLPGAAVTVVVDNSPTADLEPVATETGSVTYRHAPSNLGYGKGHNLAVQLAPPSDFHLIVNPDIVLSPEALPQMVRYLLHHPDIGLLGPKLLHPDGSIQHLNRRLPTVLDLVLRRLPRRLLTPAMQRRIRHHEMQDVGYEQVYDVACMSGAFMLCRRSAFDLVGGFDQGYFMYFEDFDLCRRLQCAGFRTVYYPFATAVHLWGRASTKEIRMTLVHIQSMMRFFNKWGWRWW